MQCRVLTTYRLPKGNRPRCARHQRGSLRLPEPGRSQQSFHRRGEVSTPCHRPGSLPRRKNRRRLGRKVLVRPSRCRRAFRQIRESCLSPLQCRKSVRRPKGRRPRCGCGRGKEPWSWVPLVNMTRRCATSTRWGCSSLESPICGFRRIRLPKCGGRCGSQPVSRRRHALFRGCFFLS